MAPNHKRAKANPSGLTEDDLQIIEPILIAAYDAVRRSSWRLGDPIGELSGFIALVVIAKVTVMLKEIGVIREEPVDGPNDCGFY